MYTYWNELNLLDFFLHFSASLTFLLFNFFLIWLNNHWLWHILYDCRPQVGRTLLYYNLELDEATKIQWRWSEKLLGLPEFQFPRSCWSTFDGATQSLPSVEWTRLFTSPRIIQSGWYMDRTTLLNASAGESTTRFSIPPKTIKITPSLFHCTLR